MPTACLSSPPAPCSRCGQPFKPADTATLAWFLRRLSLLVLALLRVWKQRRHPRHTYDRAVLFSFARTGICRSLIMSAAPPVPQGPLARSRATAVRAPPHAPVARLSEAARGAAISETVTMAAGAAATAQGRLMPLASALSAPASAMTGADAARPAAGTRPGQSPAPAEAARTSADPAQQPSIFAFNQAATPTGLPALGLRPSPIGGSGAKVGAAGGMVETPVGSPMPAHALSTLPSPSLAGFDPVSPAPPRIGAASAAAGGGPAAGPGRMLPPPSAIVGTDWSVALPGRATAKGLSGGPQTRGGEELPPAQYLEALINR